MNWSRLGRAVPAVAGALVCAMAQASPARAQGTAALSALADVSVVALSTLNVANLAFGTVVAGTPLTINPRSSTSAGKFELHGARNAQFSATFTLPTQLQAGAGGPTMAVSFGAGAGCHYDRDQQNKCTLFDPSTPLVQRLRNNPPPNDTYFVWLGGTVSPTPTQQGGVYQGTITITAVYTGL